MPASDRLGRAAYFAFRTLVAGSAGATLGCGAATGLEGLDPTDAGLDAGAPVPGVDAGAPVPRLDAGVDAGLDAGSDAGMGGLLYGAPPIDAGMEDAGSGVIDLYGGPPMRFDAGPDDAGSSEGMYGGPPSP